MTPIVSSVEISRRSEDVFEYVTDPSRVPDWQESVVSARADGPVAVGCKARVTRKIGRMASLIASRTGRLSPSGRAIVPE
jgi:Polyketide cyclase / dehydrase and lipid transport